MATVTLGAASTHLDALRSALVALERDAPRLEAWGRHIAMVTCHGGRALAAGNGGSAAQAQHFTAELVGRFLVERRALSAIALTADNASVTALGNDYGYEEVFARQVRAHGRAGDVLLLLSTSGRSPNVLAAAEAARQMGLCVYALTGPGASPLGRLVDDAVAAESAMTPVVQEVHQVAIHLLCDAVERRVCEPTVQERGTDA